MYATNVVKYIDGLPHVPVTFPSNQADGLYVEDLQLDELVSYIQNKKKQKAFLEGLTHFEFLSECHCLEHLVVDLRTPFSMWNKLPKRRQTFIHKYDLDVLYDFPNLKSLDIRNCENPIIRPELAVDLGKISALECYQGDFRFTRNLEYARLLKTVCLNHFTGNDFSVFEKLNQLDTLQITQSKVVTVDGCEKLPKLQCLYLHYNRKLQDISALEGVRDSLKALRIESCGKISDFSVLSKLENLELLELSGNNELPNLNFLRSMKKLNTFIISMNVLDGDLTLCKELSYVYLMRGRKHYNLKDRDMQRGRYIRGNEDLEVWRRCE